MKMIKSVCLLAIIFQVSRGQTCKSDHPKAFMCQGNSVSGPAVTLDVSTAAKTNATNCTCSLKSNITGLIVAFNDNPNSTNCGTQLDFLFEDISMQLKCGTRNQSTSGSSAQVTYTREMNADDVDSKYCLSFYANRTDVSILLSCAEYTNPVPPITPSTSSSPLTGNSEILMNSTTTPSQSNSTTTVTTSKPQSNSTTTLTTLTTTQLQSNSTATLTTSQSQSNETNNPTMTQSQSTTNLTTVDPSFHSSTVQTTTLSPFNQSANQTNTVTPNNSTTNLTTTQSTSMSTTTLTTLSLFNSTANQITLQPLSNLTTSQTYSQSLSYTLTNQTVTQSLLNSTGAQTATQLPPISTSSQNTQSPFNTTSINSTFYTTDIISNTTSSSSVNETTTIMSVNSTTRTVFNETSSESNNATYENVSTTEVTSAQNSNTSGTPSSTLIYPNATADYLNETTTDSYGNVTTASQNETTDNITTEEITTIRDNITKASSPGFWEPPFQEYGVPSGSTNIVAVIAPVSAILLLIFIAVVVFIMCKRSRKAARRTKTPDNENKTDKNYNYQRPNFLAKDPNDTMQNKPVNPADFFTVQASDKIPAKITASNELNGNENNLSQTTKAPTHLHSVDSIRKANGDTTFESGKPKIYEPNEREKDILDNLELASIVIESDPNDSNRYFKKTDPGDWYRVIMKGKKPRDSEDLLDTFGSTKTRSKRKNAKSSGSEDNSDREKHRSRKSRSHTEKHQKKHNNHNTSKSSKSRSSDSDEKTYSGNEKKRHISNTTDAATKVNKSTDQQRKYDDITGSKESIKSEIRVQPKLVISKPLNKETMHSNSQVLIQPKQVISKPVNERNNERETVQTRLISSKSSSVTMPVALPRQNSTGSLMNRDLKETDTEKYGRKESSELASSISRNDGSETSSFLDRNTPQRSSQTRNTLFSSGSKLSSQNGGADNEKGESKLKPVKRPDIVPPLNLTGTGDKVGRTDDGFEEFLLN